MLSELYHYISQNPKPGDAESVKQCMLYLEACNKLFENGFLTHQRIFDLDSCVLRSIHEGYFFVSGMMNSQLKVYHLLHHSKMLTDLICRYSCF